eukprot:10723765-Alexandrium_andersonii.AAC.1
MRRQAEAVMNKCINAGKAKPDPNFPDDPEERFYWALIDPTPALDTTLEDSSAMEGNCQIGAGQAQETLGDDTGFFGANSLPRIEGMNPTQGPLVLRRGRRGPVDGVR